MTISQAKNEIEKLENQLDLYLSKKKINFERTQPESFKLKDIVVSSNVVFDKFTHYVIKDSEYDDKIYEIQESILAYQKFILAEIKRISKSSQDKIMVYILKNDVEFERKHGRKRTWNEIGEMLNYSERQLQRIYKDVINGKL